MPPASVKVQPVRTRREKNQFLHLPWELYRGDPNWVPPLRSNQKELVGYQPHPFYNDAEVQTFLALRDGSACGRIAAIVNHAYNKKYNEQRGFFGFFESVDDSQVVAGLMDAARGWLAERDIHNVDEVLGAEDDPRLPAGQVDLVLLVDVYHELQKPELTMERVRQSLKPGGRVVLIEYRKEDPSIPIQPLHKMTVREVRDELEPMGFQFVELKSFLPTQHIIIFQASH